MYWTPCARLMKSMTPKTSVSPAAIEEQEQAELEPVQGLDEGRVVEHPRSLAASRPPYPGHLESGA